MKFSELMEMLGNARRELAPGGAGWPVDPQIEIRVHGALVRWRYTEIEVHATPWSIELEVR